MKRRELLQATAGISTLGLPKVSTEENLLSEEDINKVVNFLAEDRLERIESTNPGRGSTSLNNNVPIDNFDGKFENGLNFAKRVLDGDESPSLAHEAYRQSVEQYIGIQERELDVKVHYFGVEENRAILINKHIENAFPHLDINLESNDVLNRWFKDELEDQFCAGVQQDIHRENTNPVYDKGIPEDRSNFEEKYENPQRVDAFIFNGRIPHGSAAPGNSAWVEVTPAEDLEEEVENVQTSVHELGHAVYGLTHHLIEGAMTYNREMLDNYVRDNRGEEFLEFGNYSQTQIERTLNGSIELEEVDLGKRLVYRPENRDPSDHTDEFLANLVEYMHTVSRLTLNEPEKMNAEWTPLEAEYTEDMDIARLSVDNYVVELGVHKNKGFRHEDAYAEVVR